MLADMFRVPLLALGASVDATPALRRVAGLAVAVAVSVYLARQVRKPSRWIGRPFLWAMNNYHSGVTEWGLQQVTIDEAASILDVGCGGGRTVQRLAARAPRGTVCGIDYADGSIEVARRANARLIETGRVDIRKASVSELPFADATFDFGSRNPLLLARPRERHARDQACAQTGRNARGNSRDVSTRAVRRS
jgi:SAM-dependent methyltransferase